MSHYLKEELYELVRTDERIFEFIQEGSLDGVWYWDLEHPEDEWMSPRFWLVLGYDPNEMPHKSSAWQGIINQDDLKLAIDNFNKHVADPKHPYDQIVRYRHKDDSTVWIRCRGIAIRDKNGKPIRMLGAHQDITNEKEIEDKLRERENLFRVLFEQSAAGIARVSPDGRFLQINKHFCEIVGYTDEELLHMNFVQLTHSDDLHLDNHFIEKVIKNESDEYSIEKRYIHKNGSIIWIRLLSNVVRNADSSINYAIASIFDITHEKEAQQDRKKYEQKILQQNQEFEALNEELKQTNQELIVSKELAVEANRLKTEFLHNMSHEIRTPMNGIIGFAEMLDDDDVTEEQRAYYTRIIQNSSQQLLRVIDDILEISTLETNQEQLHETEFCLNDLVMEVFSIMSLKSKERNVPIYIKKELKDKQSHIVSDRTKLNKILSNILENALKFTIEGFIEFGYFLQEPNLVLYIKDTGIGISSKNHQKIFERFSQESKDITDSHGGLGLGLSISKENALLLGGDILLESEKGEGATFYVTIPYKPANNREQYKPSGKTAQSLSAIDQDYTILIAEDEEINFLYLETLFENKKDSYNIIHAKNGKEAIDYCMDNTKICLVLMDIKMPVINGLEAAEAIKSKYPQLPIIAQTAYSTNADKQLALQHGCDDFISKPIQKEQLFKMVGKYMKNKV